MKIFKKKRFLQPVCGAELDLYQIGINDHYEHLHGLHINEMGKYTQIRFDTTKQFKLQEAKKLHILTPEARRKTIGDWFETTVVTGLVENGQSKRNSYLSNSEALSLWKEQNWQ